MTYHYLFKDDDAEYNQDGLLHGSYSLNELKTLVSEYEMTESVLKYTFFDFGSDGISELVLKFESIDPSFMSYIQPPIDRSVYS